MMVSSLRDPFLSVTACTVFFLTLLQQQVLIY
uniref:Uncharacterized protein n=1 Tax=Arundo donax TaxID=35708 RepID=A0A0A8Y3C9_ARUDO